MNKPLDPKAIARDAAVEVIGLLGGPVEAALKVGAPSYQSVQSWRENGIPTRYCRRASELTGVPVQRMRPDDWNLVWPELSAQKAKRRPPTPSNTTTHQGA